jgi:hypothetical protein
MRVKSNYSVYLHDVPGLQFSKTYQVTVQVKVNGQWSVPGESCTINMLNQPPATVVRAQYCYGTYLFPHSNYILAEHIYGANQYQWRFTPTLGGAPLTQVTNSLGLAFHLTSMPLQSGVTYNVDVRAGRQGIWGDYAGSCPLTIEANPGVQGPTQSNTVKSLTSSVDFKLYPNPVTGDEFILEMSSENETGILNIEIMDITGKLIFSEVRAVKGTNRLLVNPDIHFTSGLYLLRLTHEIGIQTLRFSVD